MPGRVVAQVAFDLCHKDRAAVANGGALADLGQELEQDVLRQGARRAGVVAPAVGLLVARICSAR